MLKSNGKLSHSRQFKPDVSGNWFNLKINEDITFVAVAGGTGDGLGLIIVTTQETNNQDLKLTAVQLMQIVYWIIQTCDEETVVPRLRMCPIYSILNVFLNQIKLHWIT